MGVTATISIAQIGNGYIVSDAKAGLYGDSEWRTDESVFYPTLDDLTDAMPSYVGAAIQRADERAKELKEQLAREDSMMAGNQINTASRGVRIARPNATVGY